MLTTTSKNYTTTVLFLYTTRKYHSHQNKMFLTLPYWKVFQPKAENRGNTNLVFQDLSCFDAEKSLHQLISWTPQDEQQTPETKNNQNFKIMISFKQKNIRCTILSMHPHHAKGKNPINMRVKEYQKVINVIPNKSSWTANPLMV